MYALRDHEYFDRGAMGRLGRLGRGAGRAGQGGPRTGGEPGPQNRDRPRGGARRWASPWPAGPEPDLNRAAGFDKALAGEPVSKLPLAWIAGPAHPITTRAGEPRGARAHVQGEGAGAAA